MSKGQKLNIAIQTILKQYGVDFMATVKLANVLLDYRAFEEYPSTKPILRDVLNKGYGQKILDIYKANPTNIHNELLPIIDEYCTDNSYKKDHIIYVFDCLLFALGCLDSINEPFSNTFNPYATKGDILDTLAEQYDLLKKQYVDLLDKLVIKPNDIIKDAAGYYSTESLTQLYAVEAKILVLHQQLGKNEVEWCKTQLRDKILFYYQEKETAVKQKLQEDKDKYLSRLKSALIIPKKLGLHFSAYFDSDKSQEIQDLSANIKSYYDELGLPYDDWCENQKNDLLSSHHVGALNVLIQIALKHVLPLVCTYICITTTVKYVQSKEDIDEFNTFIALGDSLVAEKQFVAALDAYYSADTIYHGTFMPTKYHMNAKSSFLASVKGLRRQCIDYIIAEKFSLAQKNIESIPQEYKNLYPECSTVISEINSQLRKNAEDGLKSMIDRISKSNGKLSKKDKDYLNELILISNDTYWLEIIKKREK